MSIEKDPTNIMRLPFGLTSEEPSVYFYTNPQYHPQYGRIQHILDVTSYNFQQETYSVVLELDPRVDASIDGWSDITFEDDIELEETINGVDSDSPDMVEGETSYTEESISNFVLKRIKQEKATIDKKTSRYKAEIVRARRTSKRAGFVGLLGSMVGAGFGYEASRTASEAHQASGSLIVAVGAGITGLFGLFISAVERSTVKESQERTNGDIETKATLERIEDEIENNGVRLFPYDEQ